MTNYLPDLTLLKQQLKISDTNRDGLLNAALAAASRSVDDFCGRRFYLDANVSQRIYYPNNRIYSQYHSGHGEIFLVDDIGSTSGLIVERGSNSAGWTDITSSVEYWPENAAARGEAITGLVNVDGWSFLSQSSVFQLSARDRIRVTAKWGWPAVPDQVVEATLILAARLYKRNDSPEGVLGSSEWGTIRLSRTDPDVASLLSRFVLLGIG